MNSGSINTKRSFGSRFGLLKSNMGIFFVLIVISIIFSLLTPNFLTVNNLISVLRQITNNIFLALGMTLVIILGGIDLSVGATVAMTGTMTVGLIVTQGVPMYLAIVIGLIIGVIVGYLNGLIISVFKLPAFIVTLATMNITKGFAYIYSGGRSTRITNDIYAQIGTGQLFGFIPYPVIYMIIFIIIFSAIMNSTKMGTYIYAVGGNRESARLSGVSIRKVELFVFTLSGFMAAFAGLVLSSRMFSGQPSSGDGYEMDAIAACVLGGVSMSGGTGKISGTVIGAMVIGVISNGLNLVGVSSFWQNVVKGMIILAAVIIDSRKNMISDRIRERKNRR